MKKKLILINILIIIIIILLIQLLYIANLINFNIISSPFELINLFFTELISGKLNIHILSSLKRVLMGYLLAFIIGYPLGILFGINKHVRWILEPYIELLRPIPPIAWIPIAIILFGLGDPSSIFIVFLAGFFPIFSSTMFGILKFPEKYSLIIQTLHVRHIKYYSQIIIPYSLPYLFNGLKIGIGMAWMSVIACEMIGAQSGMGYYIQINRLILSTDKIIIGMITIGILGFILIKIISKMEKKLVHWSGK